MIEKPVCYVCVFPLLDGSTQAFVRKGDVGSWENLSLLCEKHLPKGMERRDYKPLRCECGCGGTSGCGKPAVALDHGALRCEDCIRNACKERP